MNTLRIAPTQHLTDFNVFDVGANKNYLNQGLIDHESRTELLRDLKTLHEKLLETTEPHTIAFSGDALEFLELEGAELLQNYQELVATGKVQLATQPYYGTAAELLSQEDFCKQCTDHQALLQQHFGKQATTLLASTAQEKEILQQLACNDCLLAGEVPTLKEYLQKTIPTTDVSAELQMNLLQEMNELSPYVHATEDQELIGTFCRLATYDVLAHAHPEQGETPYDHYTTLMSILHDVAHRIKAHEAIKQGIFLTQPRIGESPVATLRSN